MMKKLFQAIDLFVFKKVAQLRGNPNYAKIVEPLGNLPEEYQGPIGHLAITLVIFSPLVLLVLMSLQISQLEEDLSVKTKILTLTKQIIEQDEEIQKASRLILAPAAIEQKSDFEAKLASLATRARFAPNLVRISDFDTIQDSPTILETRATVKFSELTLRELERLLRAFHGPERIRVAGISIQKDPSKKLLNGEMALHYYGRLSAPAPGQE